MFNKNSNAYTFLFAAIVCIVCSFLLSFVSASLKNRQDMNVEVDIKKNILKSVVLQTPLAPKASAEDVLAMYDAKIKEDTSVMPLYIYQENDIVKALCYPIKGKGLWSTLYGYLAIEPDAKTVRGMTFYKHGETPGLGAEIDKAWFLNNYKGKRIWSDTQNALTPVAVVKGKVKDMFDDERADSHVDGISGATITSKGVTDLVDVAVRKYEPFFKAIRNRKGN